MIATKVGHFSGHQNSIYTIIHSNVPGHFYSGASDGYVVEWNYLNPGDGNLLVNVLKPVYALQLLNQSHELLIGTATGNLHVIDLDTRLEKKNIEAHKGGIFSILHLNNQIYTAGEDGMIRIWQLPELSLVKEIHASEKSVRTISYSPTLGQLAAGFSDHRIRIYSQPELKLETVLDDHNNSVFALAFNHDGSKLISGGRDARLHVRDVANQFLLEQDIPAHTLHINCIAFNPSGTLLATASMDKSVKIWDAKSFALLKVIDKQKLDGHLSSVNKILWLNDTQLLSCSDDRTIMKWELSNW